MIPFIPSTQSDQIHRNRNQIGGCKDLEDGRSLMGVEFRF